MSTSSLNPSSINVTVNQGPYTETEREVMQIKPDASLTDFLSWQKSAIDTLSLTDNFDNDILIRPRLNIHFAHSCPNLKLIRYTKLSGPN